MAIGSGEYPVLLIFVLSHVVTAVLTLGLTVYVVRNFWKKPIGRVFAGLVGAITVWIVSALARTFTSSLEMYIAVTGFKYVGIATAPVCFVLFGLLYDGKTQWVTRRVVTLLLVFQALTVPVAATTHVHGLFYSSYSTSMVDGMSIITVSTVGPWYWLFVGYSWFLVAIGSGVLVYGGIKRSRFYRVQLFLLVPAIIVSWAANIAYAVFSWPHPALDPTPIGFGIASFLLAIGIFSTKLIDITPAARSLVLDAIDDAVIVVGPEDRVVDVNDAARPLFESGVSIGEPVTEAVPEEIAESVTPNSATIELTIDSQQRYYRHRQLPVGPDGTHGSAIVLTDVTSEVEARQQLQQTNQELDTLNTRFQLALEETDTGVWEWDLDTDEVIWDEASEQLYGYDPGKFPGTFETFADRVHEEDLPAVRDAIESAIETGNAYRTDFRLNPDDGPQRWVQVRGVVEYDEAGEPTRMIGIQTDITDQKQRERAVDQARKELRQIIDLIPDPLFVKNQDDEVLLSNEANAELLGSAPEEIEGKPEPEIMPDVENYEQYRQRDLEVIETGKSITFEEELTDTEGETHVFRTTRIPFATTASDEDAVLGYARDVTALKEYEQELEATKRNLEESNERIEQTNEELERLNRILRHDIRNNVMFQTRLGKRLKDHVDDEGADYLDQLLDRSERITDLTVTLRDLMTTMVDEERELTSIPVDAILESEIENMRSAYEDAIVRTEGELPRNSVRADQMLSSVFRNLLKNAIQHNDKQVPEVEVSVRDRDDDVTVRIADNGPGIPSDARETMFGKGEKGLESKGTGIGLYLVSELVDEYGGTVRVEDNEPEGSVFILDLPKSTAQHSSVTSGPDDSD